MLRRDSSLPASCSLHHGCLLWGPATECHGYVHDKWSRWRLQANKAHFIVSLQFKLYVWAQGTEKKLVPSCSVTANHFIKHAMIESKCERNWPGLRAESIPRQLEDLEAQAKQDRVFIPYRAHQNSQHHRLEWRKILGKTIHILINRLKKHVCR